MNLFLGIDIGTTHTKAVALTVDGQTFFKTKQTYDIIRPEAGYEEQNADIIFNAVTAVIKEAFLKINHDNRIVAISFSAAMHSILPVDENGKPLYNAIIWADTRSRIEAETMAADPCAGAIVYNTGIPFHPMSPFCKILWFKNNRPDIFSKTSKFISIKEYVFFRFFKKYIVDYSIASATGLFNIHEQKWDKPALRVAGIDESKLSQLVSTIHEEHELLPKYAELFGIKETIPFVAGASDGCLANLGSGAIAHGEVALTIGTSGAVRMTVEKLPLKSDGHLFTYPLTNDLYVRGGAINNGGIILQWLVDMFLTEEKTKEKSYEEILHIAQQVAPGANGLLFLPYLLGERAPIWDAEAKGVLLGLTMQHKKEHIVRAALEGICFALYHIITELEAEHGQIKEIFVNGGFVQSPFWIQLLADITGKKLNVTEVADASAIGAAYLAMNATGYINNLSAIKEFTVISNVYEPDLTLAGIYRERFKLFISLYPKLKDYFVSLSG